MKELQDLKKTYKEFKKLQDIKFELEKHLFLYMEKLEEIEPDKDKRKAIIKAAEKEVGESFDEIEYYLSS